VEFLFGGGRTCCCWVTRAQGKTHLALALGSGRLPARSSCALYDDRGVGSRTGWRRGTRKRLLRFQKTDGQLRTVASSTSWGSCRYRRPVRSCCSRFQSALRARLDASDQSTCPFQEWTEGWARTADRRNAGTGSPPRDILEMNGAELPASSRATQTQPSAGAKSQLHSPRRADTSRRVASSAPGLNAVRPRTAGFRFPRRHPPCNPNLPHTNWSSFPPPQWSSFLRPSGLVHSALDKLQMRVSGRNWEGLMQKMSENRCVRKGQVEISKPPPSASRAPPPRPNDLANWSRRPKSASDSQIIAPGARSSSRGMSSASPCCNQPIFWTAGAKTLLFLGLN